MRLGNPFIEDPDIADSASVVSIASDFSRDVWPRLGQDPDVSEVIQTGIRQGMPLLEHLAQGVGFLLSMASFSSDKAFRFSNRKLRILIAAFVLHDLNKLRGEKRSLSTIVRDDQGLRSYCQRFGLDTFLSGEELPLEELRFLIENASDEHGKRGSGLLGKASQLPFDADTYLSTWVPWIQAADIHDLSGTLEEKRFKGRLAGYVAKATGQRVFIVRYSVTEHRGTLTQIIHRACDLCFEEIGAKCVWLYPLGSAYLLFSTDDFSITELLCNIKQRFAELRSQFLSPDDATVMAQMSLGKDGLKLPSGLHLMLPPERLAELVKQRILDSHLATLRKTLSEKRSSYKLSQGISSEQTVLPGGWLWEQEKDSWLQAGRCFQAAENILKAGRKDFKKQTKDWPKDVAEILWARVQDAAEYNLADLAKTDPLYERPFLLGGNLPGGLAQAAELVRYALECVRAFASQDELAGETPELERYVGEVVQISRVADDDVSTSKDTKADSTLPKDQEDRSLESKHSSVFSCTEAFAYLKNYLENSPQRSAFGASTAPATPLVESDIGKSFGKVSQFSNSQPLGKTDPKRLADKVTQHALRLQRVSNPQAGSDLLFVHVSPRDGMSLREWRDLLHRFDRLSGEDHTDFLSIDYNSLQTDAEIQWEEKKSGLRLFLLTREELWSNQLTVPFYSPAETDTLRYFQAITHAAFFAAELRVCAIVSRHPFFVEPPRKQERLRLENAPSILMGLLFGRSSFACSEVASLVARLRVFVSLERLLRGKHRRLRGKIVEDDHTIELAAALRSGKLHLLHVADKLITKKNRKDRALQDTSQVFQWVQFLFSEKEHDPTR